MEIGEEGDVYFSEVQGNIHEEEKDLFGEEGLEGREDEALEGDVAETESIGDAEPGFEDAYEIRDEEDGAEVRETSGAEGRTEEKKDDNMLVVDEWDNEDVESISDTEEAVADDVKLLDPEDGERGLLHMPSQQTVMGDLIHLRRNRRLSVYPVTITDLNNATLQTVLGSEKCEEAKMQFIRPSSDPKSWTGFLSLTFVTSKAASKAVDELKTVKDGLNVKNDSNPDQTLDHFIKEERKALAWPTFWADKLLLVRGVTSDTKSDELRALFASAEEIAVVKESSSSSSAGAHRRPSETSTRAPGYAYVLYETASEARSVADEYMAKPPEFKENLLDIRVYREPPESIPRSLLWLRRRKLVLKHLDRLMRNLEKSRKDPTHKIAPWTEKRITACKNIIEKDDKTRVELGLPTPSLEDFKQIRGLRPYRPEESERILVLLGIMEQKKKQQPAKTDNKDGDKAGGSAAARKRNDERKRPPPRRGSGKRGRNGRRPSPPSGRRRDWSPERSGRYMGRDRGGGIDPSALSMMNPLALAMMQQNMGLMGGVNPALLNQMLLNPAVTASMMGGGPAGGPLGAPFLGGAGGRGLDLEPSQKMLRLDETGNFRPDRDFRGGRDGRGFDRERDDRGPYRDRARHRSRSPEFSRSGRSGGGPGAGSGGAGPRGFDGGPRDMGQRGGFDLGGGANSGAGPVREDDINILMNLSKMLSQKMEQKRQQVEHGGYDRM